MIIDFHTHIFPDKIAENAIEHLKKTANIPAHSDGTLEGLKQSMKKAGIDYSVTLPIATKPSQVPSINSFAAEIKNEPGIISFGSVHHKFEGFKEQLDFIKSKGIKGIKLHPDYQDFYIDDDEVYPMIEYAASLGLIIVFHAGLDLGFPDDVKCTPRRARKLMDRLKYNRLVFAHMGGYQCFSGVCQHIIGQDVYLDTSFVADKTDRNQLIDMINRHGANRILFATDSPWDDQKTDVEYIKSLGLTDSDTEKILHENAEKLLDM